MLLVTLAVLVCVAPTASQASDTEAPAAQVSAAREGFELSSQDGAYVLRFALRAGLKIEPAWTNGDRDSNGTLAFVRPILRGNLLKPWLRYEVSMELARDPFLLDAFVDVQPWEALGFRLGQQGTPVSRHETFGPHQIFFPEYASVAGYFWSGREKGVTVYGSVADERLDYFAGFFGGSPITEPFNEPSNYVVETRVTFSPMGPVNPNEFPITPEGEPLPFRLSLTAQGYNGTLLTNVEDINPTNSILTPQVSVLRQHMNMVGGDIWLQGGPVIVFGEFYWRHLRRTDDGEGFPSFGTWGEVVLNAYADIISLGGRVNWIDPNTTLANDRALEIEGQVAWLILPPQLVLKLRYAWVSQRSPGAASLGDVQLPFPTGTSHVATLQLTLAF